jgi:Holliday junction resolvase RusA-like endonuclease
MATLWIPGEPVAKSTQRPPRGKKKWWIVQNDPKYARLKKTWAYQRHIADCAVAAGLVQFLPADPVRLSCDIFKAGRKTGDLKNIVAAIEDGLQYGGFIPNDRQITSYGEVDASFSVGKEKAGVSVSLQVDPRVADIEWLTGWLGSKKKAVEYQHDLNVRVVHGVWQGGISPCLSHTLSS